MASGTAGVYGIALAPGDGRSAALAAAGTGLGRGARGGASIGGVEAILFDWDGTLVDSLGAFHRANAR